MSALAALCDALARDDVSAALDHALAAWSDARGDALAQIILELYARTPARPVLAGANHFKRWQALEALADPRDIPRQVEYLRVDERFRIGALGIEALAKRPANPMLAQKLAQLIASMPYRAPAATETYHRAIIAIARAATPEAVSELRTFTTQIATLSNANMRDQLVVWIHQALAEIAARPQPTLDLAAARAALAAHAQRLTGRAARTEQLLAAVYANLADDAPRLVLADHLAELGDPRGELIALQCRGSLTPKQQARANRLVELHGRAWLAELGEDTFLKDGLVYERGFLARARVRLTRNQSSGNRLWSTLRVAEIEEHSTITELVDPVCVSLRALYGVDGNALDLIESTGRVLPIEMIGLDYGGDDRLAGLADIAPLLPNLREVQVAAPRSPSVVHELLRHVALDRLRVSQVPDKSWRDLLGPQLKELVFHAGSFVFTIDRDQPGVLHFDLDGHGWEHVAQLHFDATGLDRVRFHAAPTTCEACTRRLQTLGQLSKRFGVTFEPA